jgi:hypothetical protein
MNLSYRVALLSICFVFQSIAAAAQQKVDLSSADAAYKGGFFRVSAGIAPGKITYTDALDGNSVGTVHFNILGGKRLNRNVAPYAHLYGNVLVKQTNALSQLSVAGMGLGTYLYLLDPNMYLTPEAGLAILVFEENGGNDYMDNLGGCFTIRTGKDWHLTRKAFAGVQIFYSFFFSNSLDDEYAKGRGSFYGVNVSLKFGK